MRINLEHQMARLAFYLNHYISQMLVFLFIFFYLCSHMVLADTIELDDATASTPQQQPISSKVYIIFLGKPTGILGWIVAAANYALTEDLIKSTAAPREKNEQVLRVPCG
ncbi:hypothetical protein BDB00DRAFT_224955 [Zychaea mexicana]|uniref:uncharacterized protein n=1 Tax=Zychaea mexicana TaxID=64656 RepID=UPI0022FE2C08|nr:uncharacterized protein BDB00DRAFT_224955 [Zychaea mexicana]KAI9499243.1 hypothetical protein BDB00DRAFT_224955 [Zychaea mexicana]